MATLSFRGAVAVCVEKLPEDGPEDSVFEVDGVSLAPHGRPWWWAFESEGADPWACGFERSLPIALAKVLVAVIVRGWPDKIYYFLGEALGGLPRHLVSLASRVDRLCQWLNGFGRN